MAAVNSTTPKEDKDLAQTPWPVFRSIEQTLGIRFAHDVCAGAHTTKVIGSYWTEDDDALDSCCWSHYFDPLTPLWMNPPYSKPAPWIEKAAQAASNGLIVVGLVNDDPSTGWYKQFVENVATACYRADGRIRFLRPDGTPLANTNPWSSVAVVWTPWRTGSTHFSRFNRKPS